MAELKGKFITLACSLLETKQAAKDEALKAVLDMTGKNFNELEPEGWYDAKVLEAVFKAIEKHTSSITSRASLKLIGQKVYPTIKKTAGLPNNLITPLDFVKFEAEGFLLNHKGADVKPRKIIAAQEGKVIMEATSPGYNCTFIEGVFLGILEMSGVSTPNVVQTRCIKKGDADCEYEITWKA